ncbi:hypothetical protein R4I43_26305 [Saccharopolyspora sp. S2-29]|uniref:Uncharacterized protein n=1 Tax=Saccharopolyspora mangrovi TaxID=3082379 RepID=A0ABU6AHL8_9PSEU|nr:hypothetical protein [Saccharopolyspora sp. S2-29]
MSWEEIAKGYELPDGRMVVMTEAADLEEALRVSLDQAGRRVPLGNVEPAEGVMVDRTTKRPRRLTLVTRGACVFTVGTSLPR